MPMWRPEVTLANDFLEACFRIPQNPFIFNNYRRKKEGKQLEKPTNMIKVEVSLAKSDIQF